jgi:hypothetical protein
MKATYNGSKTGRQISGWELRGLLTRKSAAQRAEIAARLAAGKVLLIEPLPGQAAVLCRTHPWQVALQIRRNA